MPFAPPGQAAGGLASSWMAIAGKIQPSAPVVAMLAGYRSCGP